MSHLIGIVLNFLKTLNAVNWLVILAGCITISAFFEKVFGVKAIGYKTLGLMKKLAVWLSMPFDPINPIVSIRKDIKELGENLHIVRKEVTYNGGGSLKDQIKKLEGSIEKLQNYDNDKRLMLEQILSQQQAQIEWDPRMIFKCNENGACTFINRAFLTHFNWIEDDVLDFSFEALIAQEDLDRARAKWKRAIEVKGSFRDEHHIACRNGTFQKCLVQASPIIWSGELKGFYGTVTVLDESNR